MPEASECDSPVRRDRLRMNCIPCSDTMGCLSSTLAQACASIEPLPQNLKCMRKTF